MYTLTLPTPAGPAFCAIVDDDHVVLAAGFTDDPGELSTRMGLPAPPPQRQDGPVHAAIIRYLEGDLQALNQIAVRQEGTEFQQQVWDALRKVPAGQTSTYGQLADAVGRPRATRAVGSACGRNLIAPFIPCHRATRSDGTMGGYYYGLAVKDWLLRHESGHS
ncbi:MAG: methylated-DNA--[protein]-cysteine S-methyltransferase [Euzebya sp.]